MLKKEWNASCSLKKETRKWVYYANLDQLGWPTPLFYEANTRRIKSYVKYLF